MLQLMLVVALAVAVGIAVFAVQNTTPVEVTFLVWRAQGVAASVLVLVAAALGAGAALLLGAAREVRLRWRLRAQAQELADARGRLRALDAATPSQYPADARVAAGV
jgi:lipopolysaccharide assembly protein A